jgi:hypothetical protein
MLNLAHRADEAIRTAVGRPYHVVIGIGLTLEIIDRIRQLHEATATAGSLIRTAVTIAFCLVLLLHQLGELSERIDNRNGAGRLGRRRTGG